MSTTGTMERQTGSKQTDDGTAEVAEVVTMVVAGQCVGIPVSYVRDILGPQKPTRVPRAAPEVAGVLNLRGRIVTAIDLRKRLRLEDKTDAKGCMSVVVDHEGELYSLLVDEIREVLKPPSDRYLNNVLTLPDNWKAISNGLYRLEDGLLVMLDIDRTLDFTNKV